MDEEFLELEARLYAQIHHEAPFYGAEDFGGAGLQSQQPEAGVVERRVTATSVVNRQPGASRVPAGRYWTGGGQNVVVTKNSNVNNGSTAPAPVVEQSKTPTATTKTKKTSAADKNPFSVHTPTAKTPIIAQPPAVVVAPVSGKQKSAAVQRGGSLPPPKQSPKNTNTKTNFQRAAQNWQKTNEQVPSPNLLQEDLRFNPAASWLKSKAKAEKKPRKYEQDVTTKGPFVKQVQRLQKAMRIEAKKQKSKQAKSASAKRNPKPIDVIVLPSSDEEDSDVIVIPVPPPPTVTIDDSDEEKKEDIAKEVLKIDENARDAADVNLDNSHFAKPQLTITDAAVEKRTRQENSSRCTSPCSVLSSDDFIGQNDRSRLLDGKGMADDEDLLLLTADVDSLMEAPKTPNAEETLSSPQVEEPMAEEQLVAEESSSNDIECTADFLAPSTSKKCYRVEQTQFRAVDVYESESDITDSVYSKGALKETVIRAIDSSSDNDDVQELLVVQKTKRLRKRRASSSNKESDANNDESTNSGEDNDGVETTGVPFISRGPAVERIKTKKRKDSLSSSRRASVGGGGSVGHMSDNEFLATLNSLAQAQGNDNSPAAEQEDESDMENVPTARDIAEKVLQRNRRNAVIIETDEDSVSIVSVPVVLLPESFNAAVPKETLTELDTVFATIDQLAKGKERPNPSEPVVIDNTSDHSDVDVEVVEELPTTSAAQRKMNKETGDPVYHVVYSRGSRYPGGIGWNDEMRRFYNNSWKGETFHLRDVWQQMNNDKKLWKIYTEDRFPKDRRFNNRNLKCYNCCEFGHTRAKCTRRKKPAVCYMCGEYGHFEPRCPNTICLRCGNKTHVFTKSCNACTFQNRLICPVCKVRGHDLKSCPDKWRRYHSTTEPNTYPSSTIEYKNRKFCCICAGRGHLSETCKSAVRFMEYPTIISEVKSHQKSYNDQAIKMHQSNLCFNLLYAPCENFSFELAENTTPKKYYGRFLNSVGMGYMLKRKRKLSALTADDTPKRAKNLGKKYVPNPYSKAGQKASNTPDDDAPDQVQEITESGNLDDDVQIEDSVDVVAVGSIDSSSIEEFIIVDEVNDDEEESIELAITEPAHEDCNNFKAPIDVLTLSQSPKQCEHLAIDSDSNYSFSEHFEMPTSSALTAASTQAAEAIPEQIVGTETEPTSTAEPANAAKANPCEMDLPLPDFIPLTSSPTDDDEDENIDDDDAVQQAGISRRYVSANSDEGDSDSGSKSPLPDLPCDAKIFITHFHSSYLLSPKGHAFLVEKSKECDIKARLDWTSVGHVLVIYGLPLNQNNFHRELLLHYRQLSDQMKLKRSENHQKVPKRTDVLVRFLRDDITQLLNNLGNPNELLKRLKMLEKQHSKNCFKASEKVRRLINMILIGQAGLMDGNMHLDKLLLCLKTLINDYNSADVTPNELRNEIDEHWKVIFTPYRHDNYPELVQNYNKLILKNRLPKLNIDPLLLGQKVLDTSLSAEQKEQLDKRPAKAQQATKVAAKIVPNPLNPKNSKLLNKQSLSEMAPPAPSMKIKAAAPVMSPTKAPPAPSMHIRGKLSAANTPTKGQSPSTPSIKTKASTSTPNATAKKSSSAPTAAAVSLQTSKKSSTVVDAGNPPIATSKKPPAVAAANQQQQPPFANPQQKSKVATKIKEVAQKWESTCDNLLIEIDAEAAKKGLVRDSKAASVFWSRESMRYLDECIKLAESNNGLLEKLQRVQKKSQSGALSYNDYRAVIKLHSAMLG